MTFGSEKEPCSSNFCYRYTSFFLILSNLFSMRFFLLLPLVLLFFSSCEKDQFDRLEYRLEGTWEFTEARQRDIDKPLSTFYSVFAYYKGDKITFYEDETLVYEEANGTTRDGLWSYHAVSTGDEREYVLSVVIINNQGAIEQYVWTTNGLGQPNRLQLDSHDNTYEQRFVLWRQ